MSRIGKAEIIVPAGVKVRHDKGVLHVEGPKGKLSQAISPRITLVIEGGKMVFTRGTELKMDKALHGTSRALAANMVKGVTEGFVKSLEIVGVGYRGEAKGKGIQFLLGFSHPVQFDPPEGVTVKMEGNTSVRISGLDKQKVGQAAAAIRGFKPPEPYKGKGIQFTGEKIRRKEVKKS